MRGSTAGGLERPGDREKTAVVIPLDQLPEYTGRHLGYSAWQRITQERINRFAAVTGDWQWIHVAPQRAARGPFGASVAHGFLTLALFPPLLKEILHVHGASLVINYGLNWLRFPAPCRPARRRAWAWSWSARSSATAVCKLLSALPLRSTVKPNQSVSPRWCSATTPEHLDRRPRPPAHGIPWGGGQ